jgi:tetratricopeptide (TPR) repeat protein
MNKISLLTLAIIFAIKSIACINTVTTDLNGQVIETGFSYIELPNELLPDSFYIIQGKELLRNWKKNNDFNSYNDYGVTLIYLKKYREAFNVYKEIESKKPNLYSTASNIGTIYELTGKNDSAYVWIKKAIQINPSSHDSSEWIHLNILNEKLKKTIDFKTADILGLDFGADILPKSSLSKDELRKIKEALFFQLNERTQLIKPKDVLVGKLLFELGNICAIDEGAFSALKNYDAAKAYGFNSELLTKRYNYFLKMQKGLDNEYGNINQLENLKSIEDKHGKSLYIIILFILTTLLVVVFFIKRK